MSTAPPQMYDIQVKWGGMGWKNNSLIIIIKPQLQYLQSTNWSRALLFRGFIVFCHLGVMYLPNSTSNYYNDFVLLVAEELQELKIRYSS